MRHAWHIAGKELLQNRRDRLAFLFTIVLPVIFTVVLGVIFNSGEGSRFPVALVNEDTGAVAGQLVDRLTASSFLDISTKTSSADVDKAVQDQKVAAGVIIPQGFSASFDAGRPAMVTFVAQATSTGAQSVKEAIQNVIAELNAARLAAQTAARQVAAATGGSVEQSLLSAATSLADAQLSTPVASTTVVNGSGTAETIAGGFDQSSSGSMVNWVLFSLLSIATGMVWERRRGLLLRLSTAGIKASEIIGGKMLAMVVITFLQQLLLVLLGQLAFGVDYFHSPLALFVTMISLSVLAASFGLLISSVFRSEQAVVATTVISAQLLAALGGAWFPLEITGATFSRVAHYLPTAWVVDSLHGIILKGWGIGTVAGQLVIVWIWAVGLFLIAAWRFRPD